LRRLRRVGARRSEIQYVLRESPRVRLYVRKTPVTVERPTMAQAELRYLFSEAVKEASKHTVEEVAALVGGEVVEVGGKKAIKMPDGRVLQKHMAYVKHALAGYKSPKARVEVPEWLEELGRKYFTPLPLRRVEEVVKRK
jgi:hypothetical protein